MLSERGLYISFEFLIDEYRRTFPRECLLLSRDFTTHDAFEAMMELQSQDVSFLLSASKFVLLASCANAYVFFVHWSLILSSESRLVIF